MVKTRSRLEDSEADQYLREVMGVVDDPRPEQRKKRNIQMIQKTKTGAYFCTKLWFLMSLFGFLASTTIIASDYPRGNFAKEIQKFVLKPDLNSLQSFALVTKDQLLTNTVEGLCGVGLFCEQAFILVAHKTKQGYHHIAEKVDNYEPNWNSFKEQGQECAQQAYNRLIKLYNQYSVEAVKQFKHFFQSAQTYWSIFREKAAAFWNNVGPTEPVKHQKPDVNQKNPKKEPKNKQDNKRHQTVKEPLTRKDAHEDYTEQLKERVKENLKNSIKIDGHKVYPGDRNKNSERR